MSMQADEQGHHAAQTVARRANALRPCGCAAVILGDSTSSAVCCDQRDRGMLAVVMVHAVIVRRAMRMLAAPSRACIAEPDSMHCVRMSAVFAP